MQPKQLPSSLRRNPKKAVVFISSTSDLRDERDSVMNALNGLRDNEFVAMEFFGSRSEAPRDVCLQEVHKSDVYVGILGSRYGSIDEVSSVSYTEMEYAAAHSLGLPCFIFVRADELAAPVESRQGEF